MQYEQKKSDFFPFKKPKSHNFHSLRASSPIWASKASRARTNEGPARVPLACVLFTISPRWRACSQATIFNLQETFSKPEDEKIWTAEWGGKLFFSHGTEHSKGVTMLINPASKFQISIVEIGPHGRYLITKLQVEHTIIYVINVYAPNDYREQES